VLRVCWYCTAQPTPTPTPTVLPDPIWVDANYSGDAENGSEGEPFNTIAEALATSVTHTVRVREGVYRENVEMPDGVKLIGAGADATTIDAGGGPHKGTPGIGAGVSCIGVGPETLVAGFTITGASVGIL